MRSLSKQVKLKISEDSPAVLAGLVETLAATDSCFMSPSPSFSGVYDDLIAIWKRITNYEPGVYPDNPKKKFMLWLLRKKLNLPVYRNGCFLPDEIIRDYFSPARSGGEPCELYECLEFLDQFVEGDYYSQETYREMLSGAVMNLRKAMSEDCVMISREDAKDISFYVNDFLMQADIKAEYSFMTYRDPIRQFADIIRDNNHRIRFFLQERCEMLAKGYAPREKNDPDPERDLKNLLYSFSLAVDILADYRLSNSKAG